MIKINGVSMEFTKSVTITELIENEGLVPSHVAVERNGEIVKRSDFDIQMTADGDEIEILKFVGGGYYG